MQVLQRKKAGFMHILIFRVIFPNAEPFGLNLTPAPFLEIAQSPSD